MYKIIGADGKEYGPISADQLREWIAQGRADHHTRVLPEGATEWKPLADLAEFAAALGGSVAPTTPPPMAAPGDAQVLANEILARDYYLDIGQCLSRGWDLVTGRFWFTVGVSALMMLLTAVAGGIPFAGLLLNYVFMGGLDWAFLRLVRGERAEVSDLFAGFNVAFVPLMLFSLVGQLLTCVGFLFCILPGIYLAIAWMMFTALLIIDKRLEFWPAMELSRQVVSRHWWKVFGFALVCGLVGLAGTLVCGIGIFVAMPVVTAARVYAYQDIFCPKRPAAPTLAPVPISPAA